MHADPMTGVSVTSRARTALVRTLLPALSLVLIAGCSTGSDPREGGEAAPDQPAPEPEITHAAPADETRKAGEIQTKGGSLHYEDIGVGEAVVLIHGGFQDGRMWDPQMEALRRDHRVVRYDVRGYGKSVSAEGTFAHHIDLANVLDHLGVERAALIGHSLGAGIAVDFALAYPGRVKALVLVSPGLGGYPLKSPELTRIIEPMVQAHREGDLDRAVELFQEAWTDGPARSPEDVDPDLRELLRTRILENVRRFNPGIQLIPLNPPAVARLSAVEAPVLTISGALDMPDILELADKIAAEVPDARQVRIAGSGHMVNLENPEEFNRVVLEFLAGL